MMCRLLRPLIILLPCVILIALAVPRFFTGLAVDEAFPVPDGIATNRSFSPRQYQAAAAVLALASRADGETQISRAQALQLGQSGTVEVLPITLEAVGHSPTSIQGWTFLAETLRASDPARATEALSLALELSRYDYWLAGRKARAGAMLWNSLGPEARAQVLDQARLLWITEELRPQIRDLLNVKGGPALMTAAVADPEQIRAINRYVRALAIP